MEKMNEAQPLDVSHKRSALLFGEDGIRALQNSTVLVAGCGGVGSFAIEALARSGVGRLILIDKDTVEESNINRQLCALQSTVGQEKTAILKRRIADIHPETEVITYAGFYDRDLDDWVLAQKPDYVLDCIDSIGSKKDLIRLCLDHDIPILSSMGMARRFDPTKIEITELEKTKGDPLAKILRLWKRKSRIRKKIMTVCSTEIPMDMIPGQPLPSAIFVPASAGLLMASKCTADLQKAARKNEQADADSAEKLPHAPEDNEAGNEVE